MNSFVAQNFGRLIVIYVRKGEKLLESIRAQIQERGVKDGVVISAIGSMRKMCMHGIGTTEDYPTNKYYTVTGPIELATIHGLIINGEPHLHVVCADLNRAYAGHLENGSEVQYLAEIAILEVKDMNLVRKLDKFGISYLEEKDPS